MDEQGDDEGAFFVVEARLSGTEEYYVGLVFGGGRGECPVLLGSAGG